VLEWFFGRAGYVSLIVDLFSRTYPTPLILVHDRLYLPSQSRSICARAPGVSYSPKEYVLAGIRDGFRVGFVPERVVLRPSLRNLKLASQHPDVIDKYLSAEVAHRRVTGPYPYPPLPSLQTSQFGVIPKRHQPRKWRLILDLSSPQGASVNDGIPKDPFSMRYISVVIYLKLY
jgi:hypothetical protein